ncbi:MAG: AgmX/PglI C-terminal domain-containing protein, partial [Planctomycetota bacterium]|nr:AgmX/PglI C-terminal domain-containing protein [Planctomycetota bacterium]
ILRVGIIQSGRIVEERLIRKREDVSIGQASKNTFILPASHLPKSFTLFGGKGGGYQLIFDDTMEGRVSIGDEVLDLKSLSKSGNVRRRGGRYTVELDDRSRGKIVVGEFTLLFQFIDAPPVLPKPQLPAAARGANIEWLFVNTLIVAGLVLGGGGAGLDFWWRDTGQYMQVEFGKKTRAYEMLKAEVLQEKKEEEEKQPDEPDEDETDEEATEEVVEEVKEVKKKPKKRAKPTPKPAESAGKAPERKTNRTRSEILDSVKKKTVLHTLGGDGPGGGLINTLKEGVSTAKLDDVYSGGGVTAATAGSRKEFEGQPVAVKKGGYKELGEGEGGGGGLIKKKKVEKKTKDDVTPEVQIRGRVRGGSAGGQGGSGQIDKSAVSRVLRRRAGAVRKCYEKALKRNSSLKGKLSVKFKIGTAGRITKVKIKKNGTGDAGVANCVKAKMRSWKFKAPEGGAVTFSTSWVLSPGG